SEKEPPKDVFLTIQDSIQYKTESALAKAVQSSGARAGIAIVLDHKTGEILAMANYPTFDPNNLKTINSDNLMNRAVQSVYS
ncbi:penicillin-binding transpeptidase domain-containing protein, partial [Escherichia coli]|nr:penicillin-binding transpeptidase domain-containing protein [Escherichia coli]